MSEARTQGGARIDDARLQHNLHGHTPLASLAPLRQAKGACLNHYGLVANNDAHAANIPTNPAPTKNGK